MPQPRSTRRSLFLAAALALLVSLAPAARDPLPAWNDGAPKKAILDFVAGVTTTGGSIFIPENERIAVFDNDGTLWSEQPLPTQFVFALDRIRALAPSHPEWTTTEPFAAILNGHLEELASQGEKGLLKILAATHAGMTTAEFENTVHDWITTARDARFHRHYTELVYQPMIELLSFLRANGFKTYIVSGGGVEFMRPWTESVYGIPPEQVIGSMGKLELALRNGLPVLLKLPEVDLIDDKGGKPVGIQKFIGRRPIFAVGNSDGDLEMLQWTKAGSGPSFAMIVHHTDSQREWSYDRSVQIGPLDKALDEAIARKWVVVDMKKDWRNIFAFENAINPPVKSTKK